MQYVNIIQLLRMKKNALTYMMEDLKIKGMTQR